MGVRTNLFRLCNSSDVDSSWLLWSREDGVSLFVLILLLVAFPSRILVVLLDKALFPFAPCVWAGAAMIVPIVLMVLLSLMLPILVFFSNSSLALVLRFRRSFVFVCNVLKSMKLHFFYKTRVAALGYCWQAVVRLGLTGPVTSLERWTH